MTLSFRWLLPILFVPVVALAQERDSDPIPADFDAVRIAPIEVIDPANTDELSLTYDPSQLKDAPKIELAYGALVDLSEQMDSEDYQKQLAEKIQIPISTASREILAKVEALTPEQLNTFLSRKAKFLAGIVKTLSFLRMNPKAINKVVSIVNNQFFKKSKEISTVNDLFDKNAGVVANADSRVATVQLAFGSGFGFSDWMMAQLRRSPFLKDLPERSGFYFLIGTGFSLGRTVLPNGKSRFFIEPIAELRVSTKIFSPFLFAAAGFQGGFNWENRSTPASVQIASFYKLSMLTVLSSANIFGVSGAVAAPIPPGGGAIAGIEGTVYRVRLTPAIFKNAWSAIAQFVSRGGRKRCASVHQ